MTPVMYKQLHDMNSTKSSQRELNRRVIHKHMSGDNYRRHETSKYKGNRAKWMEYVMLAARSAAKPFSFPIGSQHTLG